MQSPFSMSCIKIQFLSDNGPRHPARWAAASNPFSVSLLLSRRLLNGRCSLGNAVFRSSNRINGDPLFGVFAVSKCNSLAEDFFGEIIPADVAAFVGCMIVAVFLSLDHIDQQSCQVIGIGRSTDLIVDNRQLCRGSLPTFNMVLIKFFPFLPNTHAIRTMKIFVQADRKPPVLRPALSVRIHSAVHNPCSPAARVSVPWPSNT